MKRILFALLALVVNLAAVSLSAQNPNQPGPGGPPPSANGEVQGKVVDTAANTPLSRASITVRRAKDSALVTGALTGPDGGFRVQGLRPGKYYLRAASAEPTPRAWRAVARAAGALGDVTRQADALEKADKLGAQSQKDPSHD